MRSAIKIGAIVIVVMGAIVGAGYWYMQRSSQPKTVLRTAPVNRGDLLATINATGVVQPEEVVDVGAQVAGQVNTFGKDENGKSVDYSSPVEAGTILAQIDDSLYAADVASAKAQLELAKAGEARAEADLGQMKAKLEQAKNDWDRAQKLGPSEALAPTQYDAYKATYETAVSNVAVDEAAIAQAKATVDSAQASLDRAQRNEDYCTIKSPVKGVIISRRVNIGQTVVSSFSAPSLFLIAKDLTRIQVWVSVNEADIGRIYPGMPATFKVDTFPNRVFDGTVGKIRYDATMSQNVVTYTVEVNTDNSDGKLLPYLTANVDFETGHRENVLLVPNAALRWTPRTEQIAPEFRQVAEADARPQKQPTTRPTTRATTGTSRPSSSQPAVVTFRPGTLWVQQGQYVKPLKVQTGLTDGSQTEVQGADLAEGQIVVVGEQSLESAAASTGASPFTPQLGRARQPANAPANGGAGGAGGPGGGSGGGR